ncbi:polysaccharide deacetylase family protein [Desulfonatronum thiodismutans]|uniref:polysaccharide deacetylase family protein n=1 Tax=Desulfonatronum thiodismutans TaxID=159290 RepID=UPI0004ABEBCE|nr:polysaccharide deacetylase family protein [Desulfonatronum thiodismutans]
MLGKLQNSWEKNWPEIRCGLTGSLPDFILARAPKPPGSSVPVFCYHVVESADFEKDLVYLAENGYDTITADALLTHLTGQACVDKPSVVLTFDDCSRNLFTTAFPLLEKYGRHAVAFVAPHFHDFAELTVSSDLRPCTWDEIKVMSQSGLVDFQSHSLEHRYFPRWPEPVPLCGAEAALNATVNPHSFRTMEQDLRESKRVLSQRLEVDVKHLAFPRYDGTDEAVRIGQALGYEGFWWGVLPERPTNRPGDSSDRIVRISGEFLRRLPGEGRRPLAEILRARYGFALRRMRGWW